MSVVNVATSFPAWSLRSDLLSIQRTQIGHWFDREGARLWFYLLWSRRIPNNMPSLKWKPATAKRIIKFIIVSVVFAWCLGLLQLKATMVCMLHIGMMLVCIVIDGSKVKKIGAMINPSRSTLQNMHRRSASSGGLKPLEAQFQFVSSGGTKTRSLEEEELKEKEKVGTRVTRVCLLYFWCCSCREAGFSTSHRSSLCVCVSSPYVIFRRPLRYLWILWALEKGDSWKA